ncbi:MAG TPA: cation:proton antiporter [Bacteroidales bacterium]|nr:cation:proton antiporter [Bacteroidales bacterium]
MDIEILKGIVIVFALSIFVNLIFTRIRIPTVVGYLLTGIIAGPNLLSLAGGKNEIETLAEIGVVMLMFTIGMEFSLQHLLKIRRIVFFGGFIQVFITAGIFTLISTLYPMNIKSGIFIGFLVALSSSALVMKLLQERSEITSNYGRTVLGILIFQDLLLVPLLLFTNHLANNTVDLQGEMIILALKVFIIIGLVYAGNKWIFPRLLHIVALTKNQEIFLMSVFLICFAIALLTSKMGMSLAFGAFLAGLMISDSEYSHNVFGNFLPIKDIFASFFFVSIGMLLDLSFLGNNLLLVILTVILVISVKTIIAGGTGFILGHTLHGTLLIGLSLSQVGEFSFILAKMGNDFSILPDFYYQLFLAVAVITIAVTPFLFKVSLPVYNRLIKLSLPQYLVNGLFPLKETEIPDFRDHLVIIGKDSSALKLSSMAKSNNLKHVSIVFDPVIAKEKMKDGDLVVYGDAINEPVLKKAHVGTADIIIVSVGSILPAVSIVEKVRSMNSDAYIIVRSPLTRNVGQLYHAGADQVLPEKLEIAIDMYDRILIHRDVPVKEINRIIRKIRISNLGVFTGNDTGNKTNVLDEFNEIEITKIVVNEGSFAESKSPAGIELRKKTGVTLLAIRRGDLVIEHPVPDTVFHKNDFAYVLGDPDQIETARKLFSGQE